MSSPTHAGARSRRPDALLDGVLVVRWCVLVWLVVVLLSGTARDAPGWAGPVAVVLAAGWTLLLSVLRPRWRTPVLLGDLAVCGALLVVAAFAPALATVYPVAAALTWGARRGLRGGAGAGAVLGAVYVGAHVLHGLVLDRVDQRLLDVLGDAFSLVLAGAGIGLVSTLLQRSATELAAAQAATVRAREAAARAGEREELGRQIHDSVLQVLALVHKRGRELAGRDLVPPVLVAELADLAAAQEADLRRLVATRGAEAVDDDGAVLSLAARLEDSVRRHGEDLDVQVSTVGRLLLPATTVRPLLQALDQALGNVVRHAGTRSVWLFAEQVDGWLVLSVRDDGVGFVLDEAALERTGRLGLLRSIRGRVEQLGGVLVVDSAPGRGTELEMRVPVTAPGPDRDDVDRG